MADTVGSIYGIIYGIITYTFIFSCHVVVCRLYIMDGNNSNKSDTATSKFS